MPVYMYLLFLNSQIRNMLIELDPLATLPFPGLVHVSDYRDTGDQFVFIPIASPNQQQQAATQPRLSTAQISFNRRLDANSTSP